MKKFWFLFFIVNFLGLFAQGSFLDQKFQVQDLGLYTRTSIGAPIPHSAINSAGYPCVPLFHPYSHDAGMVYHASKLPSDFFARFPQSIQDFVKGRISADKLDIFFVLQSAMDNNDAAKQGVLFRPHYFMHADFSADIKTKALWRVWNAEDLKEEVGGDADIVSSHKSGPLVIASPYSMNVPFAAFKDQEKTKIVYSFVRDEAKTKAALTLHGIGKEEVFAFFASDHLAQKTLQNFLDSFKGDILDSFFRGGVKNSFLDFKKDGEGALKNMRFERQQETPQTKIRFNEQGMIVLIDNGKRWQGAQFFFSAKNVGQNPKLQIHLRLKNTLSCKFFVGYKKNAAYQWQKEMNISESAQEKDFDYQAELKGLADGDEVRLVMQQQNLGSEGEVALASLRFKAEDFLISKDESGLFG